MIQLNNITKDFFDGNTDVNVLQSTTVTINDSEFTAIIGPSGSGKSTLLTIIGALQKPTEGTLEINGIDSYSLSENQRSDLRFKKIGFVLQGSNLVPYLTIREQFELKLKIAKVSNKQKIDEMLERLSITKIQDKYPDDVSGGERQRAAIGLALILEPTILLADEPTASLDTEKAYQVVEILKNISRDLGTAVVMVTHDQRMLPYCDRVLQMQDGVLSEDNTVYNSKP
ncbi:MAG: ABC transporter ATP-binding protein [Erysipelothrix sp.]|nr:ABC transporter ATP-binding protein [Erysipelothrix sp.]